MDRKTVRLYRRVQTDKQTLTDTQTVRLHRQTDGQTIQSWADRASRTSSPSPGAAGPVALVPSPPLPVTEGPVPTLPLPPTEPLGSVPPRAHAQTSSETSPTAHEAAFHLSWRIKNDRVIKAIRFKRRYSITSLLLDFCEW